MTTEDISKVTVSGFNLEPVEMKLVNIIIGHYESKIKNHVGYEEIKLTLKKSEHGKIFLHEIRGSLVLNNREMLNAEAADYNLFHALSEVFDKLLSEAEHKSRTSRQKK